ncbi:MAG TPA: hypothetical protein VGJ97_04555 [Anaerolineaceae bacterium]|jgi:protein-disulfide isomerase
MIQKTICMLASAAFFLSACSPAKQAAVATPTGVAPMPGCQVSSLLPQVNPAMTTAIPPLGADDHVQGSPQAKVTILEYGDFQ